MASYKEFLTYIQKWPCTCNPVRRCDKCRHPGNPANLDDNPERSQASGSTEAFDTIKGMLGG